MCDYKVDSFQCRGHTSLPDTWEDLMENWVKDDWNTNIKCVINGAKKVAVTDYDSLVNIDEWESYFDIFGTIEEHLDLIENAQKCGVGLLKDETGTHYFFSPDAKRNAELLMEYGFLPENDIYRSLLLGYTDLSIVLYHLWNDQNQTPTLTSKNYRKTVRKYMKKYIPQIQEARDLLEKQGASLFPSDL